MLLGERHILARRGWAGEESDFFSIQLVGGTICSTKNHA